MIRFRTLFRLGLAPVAVALLAACGARGAPLPPLRTAPATITELEVTRLTDRVYLEFVAPDRDADGTTPGDIDRIEVYALTTRLSDLGTFSEDWLDAATLVAVLPVRPPGASAGAVELADVLDEVRNRDAVGAAVAFFEVVQGAAVTVVERLTPEALAPATAGDPEVEDEDEQEAADRPVPMPLAPPPPPDPPVRSYVAFGVSSRGRPADPSAMVGVPLVAPPPPPGPADVSYTDAAIEVTWEAPPTFRLAGPAPSEYVVYDVAAAADPDVARPAPLAPPGRLVSHTDTRVTFGTTRCYAVRVLDHVGPPPVAGGVAGSGLRVLGDASPATCVILTDTFPPAAPTGLIAVADTDGISLVWDENTEDDLAGYAVLRGTPPDATLQPLTVEPLVETAYRDTDVTAGRRYVYRVLALDAAVPPNASPPSAPVIEIAR